MEVVFFNLLEDILEVKGTLLLTGGAGVTLEYSQGGVGGCERHQLEAAASTVRTMLERGAHYGQCRAAPVSDLNNNNCLYSVIQLTQIIIH